MTILKTYKFRNGAEVMVVQDYVGATRYSGTCRYCVVCNPRGIQVADGLSWEEAKALALSF